MSVVCKKYCYLDGLCKVAQLYYPAGQTIRNIELRRDDDNSSAGEDEKLEITPHPSAPLGMTYMPQLPDETFDLYQGVSHTRDGMVNALRDESIKRPLHNIQRKKEEMEHKSMSGHIIPREYISPI